MGAAVAVQKHGNAQKQDDRHHAHHIETRMLVMRTPRAAPAGSRLRLRTGVQAAAAAHWGTHSDSDFLKQ